VSFQFASVRCRTGNVIFPEGKAIFHMARPNFPIGSPKLQVKSGSFSEANAVFETGLVLRFSGSAAI
jgi:hypothetical protein